MSAIHSYYKMLPEKRHHKTRKGDLSIAIAAFPSCNLYSSNPRTHGSELFHCAGMVDTLYKTVDIVILPTKTRLVEALLELPN